MDTSPFELETLKNLYAENDYPSDRLFKNRRALGGFTCEFNRVTGASYSEEQVAVFLERVRKNKKGTGGLPHLGRSFGGPKYLADETITVVA